MQSSGGETLWRLRAERLATQLEVLRMAHVGLARRQRELRAEAQAFEAATREPRYVVRSEAIGLVYRGTSRNAALTAARNARWARPWSSVVVFDGEAVIWTSPSEWARAGARRCAAPPAAR
jgi:hypothetical protein